MKKFKLSQSKDENLLKISSNKTNYEIKLNDDELSELRKELGFNFDFKLPMQEIETEKKIDWRNLTFDNWMNETKKLNLSYYDLINHIKEPETCDYIKHWGRLNGENSKEKAQWVYNQLNPIDWKNLSFPEWFYQTSKLEFDCYKDLRAHYMSNKTSMDNAFKLNRFLKNILSEEIPSSTKKLHEILTKPTILKVGEVVKIGEYECRVTQSTISDYSFYFSVITEPNHKVFSQFGLTNEEIKYKFNSEKTQMYPETKTLKELTKIYYYLKTFEV